MAVVLTIRDVPLQVRELLGEDARERGQSLQAYLLAILKRQSEFSRNRHILAEIDQELRQAGGAGDDAPGAATLLAEARASRGRPGRGASRVPGDAA